MIGMSGVSAQADLNVSWTAEPGGLTIGEEGTWTLTVTNTEPTEVTGATITVSDLPDLFTLTDDGGGTHNAGAKTLTWSGQTIPGNGSASYTFSQQPDCAAGTGQQMSADANGGTSVPSSQIDVLTPIIVLDLVDSSGNSVSERRNIGETVTWTLTVQNEGTGRLLNGADVDFELGAHFGFDGISSPSGHSTPGGGLTPGATTSWNTGEIAADSTATYEIETTVDGCDRELLVNRVEVNWADGANNCVDPNIEANSSVALAIREPDITINIDGTAGEISVTNNGAGPANGFEMIISQWPDDWEVTSLTASSGTVTFADPVPADPDYPNAKLITLSDPVDPGDTVDIDIDFDVESGAVDCTTTGSDSVRFFLMPNYTNECGPVYGTEYFTPVEGPITWSMEASGDPVSDLPVPTFTLEKTVDKTEAFLGDTLNYTITVTYTGPAPPAGGYDVDVRDTYDAGLTFSSATAGYSPADPDAGGNTLTWTEQNFTADGESKVYTLTLDAPAADDYCAAFDDYCNSAEVINPVPATYTDWRSCEQNVVLANDDACSFFPDVNTDVIDDSTASAVTPSGDSDVCTDFSLSACFDFGGGDSPTSWAGISVEVSQTFGSPTLTAVTVGGTDYTCGSFSAGVLDLDCLDTTAAPVPNDGDEVCVEYTYPGASVSDNPGSYTETASLSVPSGFDSNCPTTQAYDVETDFTVADSSMTVTPNGPDFIHKCETAEHTIEIGGNNIAYDAEITLDPRGHYEYIGTIGFSNVRDSNGAVISAFEPTDNGDGTYTWDFGDIIPDGTITIDMRRVCDETDLDWGVSGRYNNKCQDGTTPQVKSAGPNSHSPFMILDGSPTLHMVPQKIQALTPYPKVTLYIVNGGSGALYLTDLTINLDSDLIYRSHAPDGTGPDSHDAAPGDSSFTFRYDEIEAGGYRILELETELTGCDNRIIDAELTWCESNIVCDAPLTKNSLVVLSTSELIMVEHTGDPLDYCGDTSSYSLGVINSGKTDVFNVKLIELLPTGVTYDSTNSALHVDGYAALGGVPAPDIEMVGTRQQLTWDFSTFLPENADGDKAMRSGSDITLDFRRQNRRLHGGIELQFG